MFLSEVFVLRFYSCAMLSGLYALAMHLKEEETQWNPFWHVIGMHRYSSFNLFFKRVYNVYTICAMFEHTRASFSQSRLKYMREND